MNTSQRKPSSAAIVAALLAIYIIWGSVYLAMRYAVKTIPPFVLAGSRFIVPGIILLVWRKLAGDPWPTRKQWLSASIIGLLMIVGGNGAVIWAVRYVPSGITSLMVSSVPLWMTIYDWVTPANKARRPGIIAIAGVLMGLIGMVLLVSPSEFGSSIHPVGATVLICASLSWAAGSLFTRGADLPQSQLMGTGMQMLVGGGVLSAVSIVSGELADFSITTVSLESFLGLLYLAFLAALVGFTCYGWLLRNTTTLLAGTYAYVNPIVAVFLGYVIAGEELSTRTFTAAIVIISAVALTSLDKLKLPIKQRPPEPATPVE